MNFSLLSVALCFLSSKTKTLSSYIRTKKGFKVNAGEARFGVHFKMKGITSNTLDIKISGNDADNDLAVFEQTGLTALGGPPIACSSLSR